MRIKSYYQLIIYSLLMLLSIRLSYADTPITDATSYNINEKVHPIAKNCVEVAPPQPILIAQNDYHMSLNIKCPNGGTFWPVAAFANNRYASIAPGVNYNYLLTAKPDRAGNVTIHYDTETLGPTSPLNYKVVLHLYCCYK